MKIVRLPAIHHDANAVLVIGTSSAVLIDCGTAWYQALQVERLQTHLGDVPLKHILLTSKRYPCSGAAKFIQEHYDVSSILIHPDGVSALETGDFFSTWANRYDSDMPATISHGLENSAVFELGGVDVEAMYAPGHSSDGVVYRIEMEQTWVMGTLLPRADRPTRWDLPGGSLIDCIESLEVIRQQEPEVIIPMHGPAIREKRHVQDVLERHIRFFEDCKQRGGQTPSHWLRPSNTSLWHSPTTPWPLMEVEGKEV